jgi:fatty acid desaturase
MASMTIPVWLQLLIYALAVARVTGLIVADSITEPVRDAITARLDDRPGTLGESIATLITCPWCAGMWVSLAAAPLVWFHGDNPVILILALALAFSQATGMIASVGR